MKSMLLFGLIIIVSIISCRNPQGDAANRPTKSEVKDTIYNDPSYDTINPLIYPDSLRTYVRKANLLSKFYELRETDKEKYEKLFFDEFPSDFKSFETIYGNVMLDYGLQNILGQKADDHIVNFLFHLTFVERKNFIEKMLSVGVTGKWDADGVSVFQSSLRDFVVKEVNIVFPILDQKDDKYIEDFFFFLFDGPHASTELPIEFNVAQKEYPRIILLAKSGLARANEPHPIGR